MIPTRLEMKNFLPYRAPDPLRFEGIHLACLTGQNGAGKSSLLDAITWALWGKARARRDDDLVHIGQGDMHVQLDFEQEGVQYRVLRRRSAGKRGQATLDLFVFDSNDSHRLLTEPSMKQTQVLINNLLRLDYETFVHSAFLQQGKADAFTTRTPAERKKILSDILGLERWSYYEDETKERLKEIENNVRVFESRIDDIDRELAMRPGLERDLKDAEKRFTEAESLRQAAETRMEEVAHAPNDLKHARITREGIAARLREIERDRVQVQEGLATTEKQIATYHETVAMQAEIEAGYNALQSARSTDAELADKLRQLTPLNAQRAELEKQIATARARLESEQRTLRKRCDELRVQISHDIDAEFVEVQTQVADLQAADQDREAREAHVATWREHQAGAKAQIDALTVEGKTLGKRRESLLEANGDSAICPTCGQPLTAEHREKIIADLEAEIESKREFFREIQKQITDADDDIKRETAALKAIQKELKRLQPLLQRLGTLQQQADSREEARAALESAEAELAQIDAELSDERYIDDLREQLNALDADRAALGYDDGAAEDARATIDRHLRFEQLHTRLRVALESLPGYEAQLENQTRHLENLHKITEEKQAEINALDLEIARLAVLVEEFQRREQEVHTQRTVERSAYERVVQIKQSLSALDAQAQYRETLVGRRDEARAQESIYNELKRAFGKNGVPAMIIETAIPELEQTANLLLARMTDGRMHLRMNTQREKVTGGTMETLEIAIADELGERNYEMYSGGEAFRINFAIRIALSQLLARRAGAHLRTLFIDEGFGTQDENGRGKLVEAINAIQDEFDLILVITHLDDLRDSFPVHIEVEKTSNGSRVVIR